MKIIKQKMFVEMFQCTPILTQKHQVGQRLQITKTLANFPHTLYQSQCVLVNGTAFCRHYCKNPFKHCYGLISLKHY